MLTDPTGEHETIEPAERSDASAELRDQSMEVDIERELRLVISSGQQLAHVARTAQAEQAALSLEDILQVFIRVLGQPEDSSRVDGSARVDMTRPSSGVKPIVVMTLRPSSTPQSD